MLTATSHNSDSVVIFGDWFVFFRDSLSVQLTGNTSVVTQDSWATNGDWSVQRSPTDAVRGLTVLL